MSMIEKMARAMWESHPSLGPWDVSSFDTVPYMIYAKKALNVLLEPDENMIEAGHNIGRFRSPSVHFRAMIHAAIDEKQP